MESETCQFESSDLLATYLASTPLLEESWRQCSRANVEALNSFSVDRVGEVVYVAFSGVQMVDCSEESCRSLVDLESGGEGIFSALCGDGGGDQQPIMVHGGLLQLFLFFYHTYDFRRKLLEIMKESKSVVITGHSLGGAVASLTVLWLLSIIQGTSPSFKVLCITYGSPMLGNQSFSQALLRARRSGNFCHIVGQHDIVPRMLFAPATPIMAQLRALFQFWHSFMASPDVMQLDSPLSNADKADIFNTVMSCAEERARGENDQERSWFWPFGSYVLCTDKGVICLDNSMTIVRLLCLMLAKGSANSCTDDHLRYGDYVQNVGWQCLQRKSLTDASLTESSYEAGIALALQSSGIAFQEPIYTEARECLALSRQWGRKHNLNTAKMAVSIAKFNPLLAQIEWYKTFCDHSADQLGYYDSFKQRTASKRGSKVNMNRLRLGQFWDEVINKLETNQLTHDFDKQAKYVHAAQFYRLLVEPLEIAEFYRTAMHKKKGHYMEHGRAKRFKILERWWRDRNVGGNPLRTRFASLTQDSHFWARVEEARDVISYVAGGSGKMDSGRLSVLLDKVEKFEQYATGMIERKEVSMDVLAKNSSYNLFLEEWKELKFRLQLLPPRFPVSRDCMVQDIIVSEADNALLSAAFYEGKLVS